jgi:hypothetical protein
VSRYDQNIKDIEALISKLKSLKNGYAKQNKLLEKSHKLMQSNMGDTSPKQHQKMSNDLSWNSMHIDNDLIDAHGHAADLGIADFRRRDFYQDRINRPSGWHELKFVPYVPRAMRW